MTFFFLLPFVWVGDCGGAPVVRTSSNRHIRSVREASKRIDRNVRMGDLGENSIRCHLKNVRFCLFFWWCMSPLSPWSAWLLLVFPFILYYRCSIYSLCCASPPASVPVNLIHHSTYFIFHLEIIFSHAPLWITGMAYRKMNSMHCGGAAACAALFVWLWTLVCHAHTHTHRIIEK